MNKGHEVPTISFLSIFKVALAFGLILFTAKIFTLLLLLFLGILLAVSLDPITLKLQRRGLSRALAIAIVALSMIASVALIGYVIIPSIFLQVSASIQNFPGFKASLLQSVSDSPFRDTMEQILSDPKIPETSVLMAHAASFLEVVLGGLSEIFLVLIFSIYLLIDGRRAFKWICDFFAAPTRLKLRATSAQTSTVIHSYIAGQVITSLASGFFSFGVLSLLKVPGALTLGVLAGVLDVLPILGFFMAVIPAMLLAFTVTPFTGVFVLCLYVGYHAVENYLIVPYVYGNSMKVSSLMVLLALLVAGSTAGVLGALAILPVVASYPIIERIWLVKYLGRRVILKHAERTEMAESEQVKLWAAGAAAPRYERENTLSGHQMQKVFGKKVLLVEDDPDIRSLLKDILETEGYQIQIAGNGKEGLDILARNADVGLILLDMMMPLMGGREFLDRMRAIPRYNHIPVVFLSASVQKKNTEGAVAVLKKPTDIDAVLNIVEDHYRTPGLA